MPTLTNMPNQKYLYQPPPKNEIWKYGSW